MYTIGTVSAPTTDDLGPMLDQMAGAEYRAGRAGMPAPPVAGKAPVYGELWLIATQRPQTTSTAEWIVWAWTSTDIPGWPWSTDSYTGGIRSAADVARALQTAGATVVLRHYAAFSVSTTTAETVPLT
ncbi:hypothetical protein [Kitasatospora sp. HPMI-4]|uniref:hypothetical protein n=1 Tax=Kitasatospora sp. HPMI-4 TaxID=3448443 RepID=UPI003F1C200C